MDKCGGDTAVNSDEFFIYVYKPGMREKVMKLCIYYSRKILYLIVTNVLSFKKITIIK